MKWIILILTILVLFNWIRFKAIKYLTKLRDNENLSTHRGQNNIKIYNQYLNILRGYWRG